MASTRLFVNDTLGSGIELRLGREQAHYLGRVLRLHGGDALTVFNGDNGEFVARIVSLGKNDAVVRIEAALEVETESPLKIHLVQGISRGERMDFVVQKATELGVHRISPVLTDFSVVKLEPDRAAKRREHWQKVAQSACEQCRRNIVPAIDAPQSLLDWFGDNAGSDDLQLILRADAVETLPAIDVPGSELTILIGPEGGFSEAEYERATVAGLRAVRLGPRILRTETAALAALSIAQATWGDY